MVSGGGLWSKLNARGGSGQVKPKSFAKVMYSVEDGVGSISEIAGQAGVTRMGTRIG